MKRFLLFILMIVAVGSGDLFSQAGTTGGILDVEITPKCEDDGTTQTNFFSAYVFRVGSPTPKLLGHFDIAGAAYTISDINNVTYGFCQSSSAASIDTTYDYELIPKCDSAAGVSYYTMVLNKTTMSNGALTVAKVGDYTIEGASYTPSNPKAGFCQDAVQGTTLDTLYDYELVTRCDTANNVGFITIIEKKTIVSSGALIISKVGDYTGDAAAYTPSGSVIGPCGDWASRIERNVTTLIATSTGSLSVANRTLADITITNTGWGFASITPVGEPVTLLYPGQSWYCHAVLDPTNNIWQMCPDISWNATGGELYITIRTVPE